MTESILSLAHKKALVTGAAGFIGSNLVLRLLEEGATVTAIDSLIPACGGNLFNLASAQSRCELLQIDQRDEEAMFGLVQGQDYIFNLAGSVSHETSMTQPRLDLELNTLSHISLLEACRRAKTTAPIVYTSTRQFYGNPDYLPVDETHPTRPIDVNGINKLAGENYHLVYHRAHGLKTTALRLTNTYGPRQSIKDHHMGVAGWFVNRAVTGNTIRLFGGGEGLRDFNYVTDVVDAMLLAADDPGCHGKFFNLSGERARPPAIGQSRWSASRAKGSAKSSPSLPSVRKSTSATITAHRTRSTVRPAGRPKSALKRGCASTSNTTIRICHSISRSRDDPSSKSLFFDLKRITYQLQEK